MSFNLNNTVKFGESFEAEIKIDEPLKLSRVMKDTPQNSRPTSSIFAHSLGLNLGNLGGSNRSRPIGVIRPTPQVGRKDLKNSHSLKVKKDSNELSPRSKMMPGLAAKVNTISQGGSFSKYVPQINRNSSNVSSNPTQNGTHGKLEARKKPVKQASEPAQVLSPAPIKKEESKEEQKVEVVKEEEKKSNNKRKSSSQENSQKSKQDDEKSKQGLAGRKDVVYKTLLRSVKRYYSNQFEARTEYATLTKSKQEKR